MQRSIALLGGINVGGHRVKMTVLQALFEQLGLTNVATFIASGNILFDTDLPDPATLETQIEHHLTQALGYRVPTFLRSATELAAVARYQPFPTTDLPADHTLSIMFLATPLSEDHQSAVHALETPMDAFHSTQREIYWLCRGKTTQSLVDWPRLGKTITLPALTVRNSTTIRRLTAKYLAAESTTSDLPSNRL